MKKFIKFTRKSGDGKEFFGEFICPLDDLSAADFLISSKEVTIKVKQVINSIFHDPEGSLWKSLQKFFINNKTLFDFDLEEKGSCACHDSN